MEHQVFFKSFLCSESFKQDWKYVGEFKDGKFHGIGTFHWNETNYYEGEMFIVKLNSNSMPLSQQTVKSNPKKRRLQEFRIKIKITWFTPPSTGKKVLKVKKSYNAPLYLFKMTRIARSRTGGMAVLHDQEQVYQSTTHKIKDW